MSGRGELIVRNVAYLGVALAAALSASMAGLPAASAASFGTLLRAQAGGDLVQPVGDTGQYTEEEYSAEDRDTQVRAPFTSVDTDSKERTRVEAPFTSVDKDEDGTHIRAPFVDLFVPRR
jgi:hypothetical protein